MKILMIAENFCNGGLETHIKTLYDNIDSNIEMVFAFAKYSKEVDLNDAKIYEGFNFSYVSNISEFCNDVNKLVDIIKKENIDVIHVHPYYSYFPALFASQITKTKLIYTYHGMGSINFIKSISSSILFYFSILDGALAKIFSVNEMGIQYFENLNSQNITLMPNPVDTKNFKKSKIIENKKWAIFSRIDDDKINEIKMIIDKMEDYNIDSIDIYGKGLLIEELNDYIKEKKINEKVRYIGYANDIYNTLYKKYNGVIGIGRVVIEAITMGYPVILIGYNQINGYLNYQMYKDLKNNNFVNCAYNKVNYEYPNKWDLFKINCDAKRQFDVKKVLKKYVREITEAESLYFKTFENLFFEINKLCNDENLKVCSFYKERKIYELIKKYVKNYSGNYIVDNLSVMGDMLYELFDVNFHEIEKLKGENKND